MNCAPWENWCVLDADVSIDWNFRELPFIRKLDARGNDNSWRVPNVAYPVVPGSSKYGMAT